MSFKADAIGLATFKSALARYETTVPEKLKDLEKFRALLPEAVQKRTKKTGNSLLEKAELESLVEWKL
jgi:hypothetical protein